MIKTQPRTDPRATYNVPVRGFTVCPLPGCQHITVSSDVDFPEPCPTCEHAAYGGYAVGE